MRKLIGRFDDQEAFNRLLTRVGVTDGSATVIREYDINSIKMFVEIYKNNITGFESYLKNVNKTYTNTVPRIRISSLITGRLVGVLNYFVISTVLLHHMPDVDLVTAVMVQDFGNSYKVISQLKKTDDDDEDPTVSKLEGHKN